MKEEKIVAGNYVLAVSGGVDSVALLDMLSKQSGLDLIVAHFDHGIREDSARDAEFVADLAKEYNLPFEVKREELGTNASEEQARNRRYEFLREIAKKYSAKIVTAHHADDIIESVVINLTRGTGWRGLAVMGSDIIRPLTNMFKHEIIKYAKDNNLDWCEDSTNQSTDYLRNQIREKLVNFDEDSKMQLLALWVQQKDFKRQIDLEVSGILNAKSVESISGVCLFSRDCGAASRTPRAGYPQEATRRVCSRNKYTTEMPLSNENEYVSSALARSDSELFKTELSRYFFIQIDESSAIELLRSITDSLLTRPQMNNLLVAIKTFQPEKTFEAGNGVKVCFSSRNFTVELLK